MNFENAYENNELINEVEELEEKNDFPPELDGADEKTEDYPPSFGNLGETVEHRAARHELETDIKEGREIAAQNSLKRLEKIEAEEAKNK